jgi:hypothetical protein
MSGPIEQVYPLNLRNPDLDRHDMQSWVNYTAQMARSRLSSSGDIEFLTLLEGRNISVTPELPADRRHRRPDLSIFNSSVNRPQHRERRPSSADPHLVNLPSGLLP